MLFLPPLLARAESIDLKPGLWEVTYKTDMSGMPIPADVLKSMPPEKRAKMEAAFKNRKAEFHTIQSCLSKENFDRPLKAQDRENDKDCTNTIVTSTPATTEINFQCSGREARSGNSKIEALSRERIKSTMQMKTAEATITNVSTGKWLSADCGYSQTARYLAVQKMQALVAGVRIVRKELGAA